MIRLVLVVLACAAACGRIGFDPGAGTTDGDPGGNPDGSGAGSATFKLVQTAERAVAALATDTVQPPNAIQPGDILIVGIDCDGAPPASFPITDTFGNTFQIIVPDAPSSGFRELLAYSVVTAGGFDTISLTLDTATNSFFDMQVWEYAGLAPVNTFDVGAEGFGTSTATDAATTPSFVTTSPGELLFAFAVFLSGTGSIGTGFTMASDSDGDPGEQALAAVPGSYVATATMDPGGILWKIAAATFRVP